jgi:hypothetical protein
MKLPFEFGVKLIFRLIIPGFFLALGLLPIMNLILAWNGWSDQKEYVFGMLIVFLGWLIVISDMQIYMAMEGRRFWPALVRDYFMRREERRLKDILEKVNIDDSAVCRRKTEYLKRYERRFADSPLSLERKKELKRKREEINKYLVKVRQIKAEAYFDVRNFPMTEEGEYQIQFPSRLGNLLSAYEAYPTRIYGMDSVFYWYRLWLKADKDLREEIDNQQAVADSAVYASIALFIAGGLWLFYALFATIQFHFASFYPGLFLKIPVSKVALIQFLPRPPFLWLLSLLFIVMGYLIYRVSYRFHAQFGETFKSMFDISEGDDKSKRIDVTDIIKQVAEATGDPEFLQLARKDQLIVAWRYMQFHRIRCLKCKELLTLHQAKEHRCPVLLNSSS